MRVADYLQPCAETLSAMCSPGLGRSSRLCPAPVAWLSLSGRVQKKPACDEEGSTQSRQLQLIGRRP